MCGHSHNFFGSELYDKNATLQREEEEEETKERDLLSDLYMWRV